MDEGAGLIFAIGKTRVLVLFVWDGRHFRLGQGIVGDCNLSELLAGSATAKICNDECYEIWISRGPLLEHLDITARIGPFVTARDPLSESMLIALECHIVKHLEILRGLACS